VVEENDLAGKENRKPSGEEDRKSEPQGGGDTNKILAKDQVWSFFPLIVRKHFSL
jgi:hypothetical protein